LLKQSAKSSPQQRKRIKREIFATPTEFRRQQLQLAQHEEVKQNESAAGAEQ